MGLLYGVGKGSAEPPRLLEIHYRNSAEPTQLPLIFVGKGVCFDRYEGERETEGGRERGGGELKSLF